MWSGAGWKRAENNGSVEGESENGEESRKERGELCPGMSSDKSASSMIAG